MKSYGLKDIADNSNNIKEDKKNYENNLKEGLISQLFVLLKIPDIIANKLVERAKDGMYSYVLECKNNHTNIDNLHEVIFYYTIIKIMESYKNKYSYSIDSDYWTGFYKIKYYFEINWKNNYELNINNYFNIWTAIISLIIDVLLLVLTGVIFNIFLGWSYIFTICVGIIGFILSYYYINNDCNENVSEYKKNKKEYEEILSKIRNRYETVINRISYEDLKNYYNEVSEKIKNGEYKNEISWLI